MNVILDRPAAQPAVHWRLLSVRSHQSGYSYMVPSVHPPKNDTLFSWGVEERRWLARIPANHPYDATIILVVLPGHLVQFGLCTKELL